MRLVKIGNLYLNLDGGPSVRDQGGSIVVKDSHSRDTPVAEIVEPTNVADFRDWLNRHSEDISKRGGIGPQTTGSVRQ
jgi:hypothetical protein